jgi:hypothetical protein
MHYESFILYGRYNVFAINCTSKLCIFISSCKRKICDFQNQNIKTPNFWFQFSKNACMVSRGWLNLSDISWRNSHVIDMNTLLATYCMGATLTADFWQWLTLWYWAFLQKIDTISYLVKKFSGFVEPKGLLLFIKVHYWTSSWGTWIQFTPISLDKF